MRHAKIFLLHAKLKLPEGFHEWHSLDITDRAAQLDDAHFRLDVLLDRLLSDPLNPFLDRIRNVWHHLNCFSKVITDTLPVDDRFINLAGRYVVVSVQHNVQEAFVVSQIKINLAAIVEHEYFTVLVRRKCPRINIDVRIDLDRRDTDAARVQKRTERAGNNTLANAANHATGHKNVLHGFRRFLAFACGGSG